MLGWIVVNVWAVHPYRGGWPVALDYAWIILNPVMFGIVGIAGWRRKSLSLGLIYPVLVLLAWVFTPPLVRAHRYGWGTYGQWRLGLESLPASLYTVFCILVYAVSTIIGWRMRNLRGETRRSLGA